MHTLLAPFSPNGCTWTYDIMLLHKLLTTSSIVHFYTIE